MTLQELKSSGHIIFEAISGSRAYNLATPTSDTDIKGVFILPKEQFYGMDYVGQINNESNDIVYYELRKFIQLCAKNNPNILELLNTPPECILYKQPIFDEIKLELFLSKSCEQTFGNYAFGQIKKARGLNKKIVNPIDKERKSVEDFCWIWAEKRSMTLKSYLTENRIDAKQCGLAKIPNMKGCYNLFHNTETNYQGISRLNANDICLSEIPKGEMPIALLYFNMDGYSAYCKKYKEYWDWVRIRNEVRYQNNLQNEKNYDAKNMMHTFRLLHMAREIGSTGIVNVHRADRDFLLDIKSGRYEYDDLVARAEAIRAELPEIFKKSRLQDHPNTSTIERLLINLRIRFYQDEIDPQR